MSKKKEVKVERADVLKHVVTLVPDDSECRARYPLFTDLMLPRYVQDECTRQGATLRVKAHGTCWMLTIECPSEGIQTAMGLLTLNDLVGQVEVALAQAELNWSETWEVQKRRRQKRGD